MHKHHFLKVQNMYLKPPRGIKYLISGNYSRTKKQTKYTHTLDLKWCFTFEPDAVSQNTVSSFVSRAFWTYCTDRMLMNMLTVAGV